jgi:hypothetical protein
MVTVATSIRTFRILYHSICCLECRPMYHLPRLVSASMVKGALMKVRAKKMVQKAAESKDA